VAGQTRQQQPQQTAVWYFIGAVFIFTLPNMLFPDLAGWARILFITSGVIIMVAGFVQLRRDLQLNRPAAPARGRGGNGDSGPSQQG